MRNTINCVLNHNAAVNIVHVPEHAGDVDNELADQLAKDAARKAVEFDDEFSEYSCVTCERHFDSSVRMAQHIKAVHLDRDLHMENRIVKREIADDDGMFSCRYCGKNFKSLLALEQHFRAKH